ncbi:ROK family protein [Paenibacillus roseipurpureus]|uniref:ROK family protein n=1 Tax=Paenibacillus roseopurpureus TaxID=2918901 RepID=A0AA96LLT7_9BACL|nr:ROK family protein [Paenibacillus sp. MBLB1832]WNR43471.1 ROK family protein [Paenibacillus sp. MBLB1832]
MEVAVILLAGIDIGGTKCSVSIGRSCGDGVELLVKKAIPTPQEPHSAIEAILKILQELLEAHQDSEPLASIGISCGGPLNSRSGRILSPPNLPGWDDIDIVSPFRDTFGVPVAVQNDANACALAEWTWGAGKGSSNMVFLTFGTGMGAGLILDGKLYSGTNDMAGEVGHIRLEHDGPKGYGKLGSFEGFCSGGGIAHLATQVARRRLSEGIPPSFCPSPEAIGEITAKKVFEYAHTGDPGALEVVDMVAYQLGRGLSMLIDLLNPERIVIGSIYTRQQSLLESKVHQVLLEECLSISRQVCTILTAGLGEEIGDYAALSVAQYALRTS